MGKDTFRWKAIEACYFMQPDILTGIIEDNSFDKSLLEDIGGIRCPIPIYYITKLWNLDIEFPFKNNSKMHLPMDVLNLMEACALKKLMDMFEKYGAHSV